uniref:NADH-ubiquinone oxidoreductase chain 2 n=1 Tax=Craugastor bocourti TaxID=228430 RepID=Q53EF2_9NEOB|nr:NADH dehydrogenase subunit II [Craugastor bocourti]
MTVLIRASFLFSLTIGTLTTMLSGNWIVAWVGLEMSSLAFIPLMVLIPRPRAIEAATKYFLIQSSASALLLLAIILANFKGGEWVTNSPLQGAPLVLTTIALSTKLGIAPFHTWMPDILQGLTLPTGLVLATLMKLAPLALMIEITPSLNLKFLLILGLTSVIVGGAGGINQKQLRKILAYSSISHLGWTLTVMKLSTTLALLNFMLYILMAPVIFTVLHLMNAKNMSELATSMKKSPATAVLTLLSILSLAALPPLTGFLPKWLIVQELIEHNLIVYATVALVAALINLFYYLRLVYILVLTMTPHSTSSKPPWPYPRKNFVAVLLAVAIILIPLAPTILTIWTL